MVKWVKDLVLSLQQLVSLLWRGFNPGPRNFHMLWSQPNIYIYNPLPCFRIKKLNPKILRNWWIAEKNPKKELTLLGGLTLLTFKTYYKSAVIKIVWYCHKDRHIDQWNRIESPEKNPSFYDQLLFNKDAKSFYKERTFFNIVLGWVAIHMEKNEVGLLLHNIYKSQSSHHGAVVNKSD